MLTYSGKIYNVSTNSVGDKVFTNVILESITRDRYDRPHIQEIRLSRSQMQSGMSDKFNDLKGKNVTLPVWVNAWTTRAGQANHTIFLQDCDLSKCITK